MCEKHGVALIEVCLLLVCSRCYEEELEQPERYVKAGPPMKLIPSPRGGYGWVKADPSDAGAM